MKQFPDVFRPDKGLFNLQRQMDRLFDEFWSATPSTMQSQTPACDIEETEDHFLLSFDVPGLKKEDLKIEVQDGVLVISGERKLQRENQSQRRFQAERFYGAFQRSFQLPNTVQADQIEGQYTDGVLQVAIPKVQSTQAKQVKIGEGHSHIWSRLLGGKRQQIEVDTSQKDQQQSSQKQQERKAG